MNIWERILLEVQGMQGGFNVVGPGRFASFDYKPSNFQTSEKGEEWPYEDDDLMNYGVPQGPRGLDRGTRPGTDVSGGPPTPSSAYEKTWQDMHEAMGQPSVIGPFVPMDGPSMRGGRDAGPVRDEDGDPITEPQMQDKIDPKMGPNNMWGGAGTIPGQDRGFAASPMMGDDDPQATMWKPPEERKSGLEESAEVVPYFMDWNLPPEDETEAEGAVFTSWAERVHRMLRKRLGEKKYGEMYKLIDRYIVDAYNTIDVSSVSADEMADHVDRKIEDSISDWARSSHTLHGGVPQPGTGLAEEMDMNLREFFDPETPPTEPVKNPDPKKEKDQTDDEVENKLDRVYGQEDNHEFDSGKEPDDDSTSMDANGHMSPPGDPGDEAEEAREKAEPGAIPPPDDGRAGMVMLDDEPAGIVSMGDDMGAPEGDEGDDMEMGGPPKATVDAQDWQLTIEPEAGQMPTLSQMLGGDSLVGKKGGDGINAMTQAAQGLLPKKDSSWDEMAIQVGDAVINLRKTGGPPVQGPPPPAGNPFAQAAQMMEKLKKRR